MTVNPGYCHCGCGRKVGATRGRANKYLKGHNRRGVRSAKWKGGRIINSDGYVLIWMPTHPRAHNGYIAEHIVVVEKSFGRELLKTEAVHHINQDRTDNYLGNLMVFSSHSSHLAFHKRLLAFEICGHYDWKPCSFCHQYDDPKNLKTNGTGSYHEDHRKQYYQKYYQKNKAA